MNGNVLVCDLGLAKLVFKLQVVIANVFDLSVNHYKCPLCDMTCPSPSSLRNHIKFRHSNEKPYSCDYCEYRSARCSDQYYQKMSARAWL